MALKDLIEKRRAYRSLAPVSITKELMDDLADCARLAPSCFNKQPWRYIFVHDPDVLKQMRAALSPGNEWVHYASLIIVVNAVEKWKRGRWFHGKGYVGSKAT